MCRDVPHMFFYVCREREREEQDGRWCVSVPCANLAAWIAGCYTGRYQCVAGASRVIFPWIDQRNREAVSVVSWLEVHHNKPLTRPWASRRRSPTVWTNNRVYVQNSQRSPRRLEWAREQLPKVGLSLRTENPPRRQATPVKQAKRPSQLTIQKSPGTWQRCLAGTRSPRKAGCTRAPCQTHLEGASVGGQLIYRWAREERQW